MQRFFKESMKLLWKSPVLRPVFFLLISSVIVTVTALAQDDPTGFLSALPKDFNYWTLPIMAAAMVVHWAWKKFVRKDQVGDFVTWYFTNLKWTASAFGSGVLMIVGQWAVLVNQPLFSFPVIIACFSAGWTADSMLNSGAPSLSAQAK